MHPSRLFQNHAMLPVSCFKIMQCSQSAVSKSCNTPSQLFQNYASQSAVSKSCNAPSQPFHNHAVLSVSCFTIMQCWQSPVSNSCSAPSQLFQNHAMLPVSCFKIMECSFLWGKVSIKAGNKSCSKPAWPSGNAQTQKGSNERLFILTPTHNMHIFGEIPFVKPQNDT